MAADWESSFTSVDIGTSQHEQDETSWSPSRVSRQSTSSGCFDIGSGLFCVGGLAQAIPGGNTFRSPRCQHQIALDLSEIPHLPKEKTNPFLAKHMKRCSIVGIVFLVLAIISVIAVGIALYVQYVVAKPLPANVARNAINETNICELIVDACINNTEIKTSTFPLEGSSSAVAVEKRSPYGNGERVKANFSSSFLTQFNKLVEVKKS